ncbi:HAD family hydrolase [Nocardia sp. NPDC004068]|uniref:HAD family hydrolase n=1 Tax=Nocardia sp. NPDC004068 TaxID=3364303 RepID=UPI00367BCF44
MDKLTEILAKRPNILLDFDGPVCDLFAHLTERQAARELVTALNSPLLDQVADANDPFDILEYIAHRNPDLAAKIERRLADIEVRAAGSAPLAAGADEVIRRAAGRGVVAIVSNNAPEAIDTYLRAQGLRECVAGVFGRTSADVSGLKPSTRLLDEAMTTLGIDSDTCVYVGDSTTDIEAADGAGMPAIALASGSDDRDELASHKPVALIESMTELRDALAD